MFNRALASAIVMVLCASAFADPATSKASQPATDEAAVVKKGTIKPRIDTDGYFEPVDALEVRFKPEAYSGDLKIASVVAHGASVKKNDVLISIDRESIDRQIASAETELTNAKAAADKAQADLELGEKSDALALKMQETDVANAEKALKWFEDVDGKQLLTSAELQTKLAKAGVEDQADELDQLKKMYKSEELTNATADIVVKRALRNLEVSKISQTMAEQREDKTKQFEYQQQREKFVFGIDQQKNTLATLQATQAQSKVTRKTAVDSANQTLKAAQKKLDDLKKDADGFTVKASFDGVVYFGELNTAGWQNSGPKALRVGEKATSGQVVMTLWTPGKLRVMTDIPESRVRWISKGMKARIVPTSSAEATTDGTCEAIIPVGTAKDNSQSFQLPITMNKIDEKLAPGEKASVQIELPEVKHVLVVPVKSVEHGRVKLKNDEWRDVITGAFDDDNIEIKSGLKEGDELSSK
jgi:multidrug resistance efflux pump